MPKKRSSWGGLVLIGVGVFIWLITSYSKAILIIGLASVLAWILIRTLKKRKKEKASDTELPQSSFKITVSTGPYYADFKAVSSNGDDYWLPKGRSARTQGLDIGDLIYVGQGLVSVEGHGPEPALIDTSLTVDHEEWDCRIRNLSYWPTYWGASPKARSAFLKWLSTGRADPDADMGYVFLYFYGLERRVLHDAKTSKQAQDEIPIIKREIERLLKIYSKSGSFVSYAGSLLDILKTRDKYENLFENVPPPLIMNRVLSFEHKLGLAQCSAAGKPLPSDWAFVWLMGDPDNRLRTPAYRCPDEFKKLFLHRYSSLYKDGMILPQNMTQLKLQHRVASPTFGHYSAEFKSELYLPDVSVLTGPIRKLKEIAEECCSDLESFSRAVGKEKKGINDYDLAIHLPLILWPAEYRQVFDKLNQYFHKIDDFHIMSFGELCSFFPTTHEIQGQHLSEMYRRLEEAGLGMQPDNRYGGAIPAENDKVILFKLPERQNPSISKHGYRAAALILRLGASIALADGVVSDVEKALLKRELNSWPHLNEVERVRLNAALELFLIAPPKLAGLRKQIENLDREARELLANFLTMVAQVDSAIDPREIAALEKIFKYLGFEAQVLYSKMHIAATEPVTVRHAKNGEGGYRIPPIPKSEPLSGLSLDAEKIALLQSDSERVSVILGGIFDHDTDEPETANKHTHDMADEVDTAVTIMGLKGEYSSLLQLLLTRTEWARPELEEIAADRKVFLDGALELLNERSYSLFNKPLFEGDDPILLNTEVIGEVLK